MERAEMGKRRLALLPARQIDEKEESLGRKQEVGRGKQKEKECWERASSNPK